MEERETSHEAVVEELLTITEQDVEDFMRLLPQLTSKPLPEAEVVEAHLRATANPDNEDSRIVVIRDADGHIQASATATICRIPTGEKAWIDDVVTDKDHRGLGWGRQAMDALHGWLEARGVSSVNLTSAPSRGAAGNLYESMDYVERDTRVYRRPLGKIAVVNS